MTISRAQKHRASEILTRLKAHYTKHVNDFILWKNPLELVIGTVLGAQCTDKKVNEVTQGILFRKYRIASDYASATLAVLQQEIYSLGFYKSKARYLKGIGKMLKQHFGGKVPDRLDDLLKLPGVSYKTAHLIMAKAFGISTGVAVDTHVKRLAPRLGLTKEHNNTQTIAKDLEKLYTPKDFLDVNEFLILHGRAICKRIPQCARCFLSDICPTGKRMLRKKLNNIEI